MAGEDLKFLLPVCNLHRKHGAFGYEDAMKAYDPFDKPVRELARVVVEKVQTLND